MTYEQKVERVHMHQAQRKAERERKQRRVVDGEFFVILALCAWAFALAWGGAYALAVLGW